MWIVATIIMRWATNAAWVENQWAIGQLDQMLLVAMPTQNHASPNIAQTRPDSGCRRTHQSAFQGFLNEILIVGCAVTRENSMIRISGGRQGSKPMAMTRTVS